MKNEGVSPSKAVGGKIEKFRDGILEYTIEKGGIPTPRRPTQCEIDIAKWGRCVKEGVRITCDIIPQVGTLWNYEERAICKVTVTNRTNFFRLEMVTAHLVSVRALNAQANVAREPCSPNVIQLPDIRPGASANTQNPVASWCDGNPQVPPRGGFTLLCWNAFAGYDKVAANVVVTYRAVPYFEGRASAEEPIIGT